MNRMIVAGAALALSACTAVNVRSVGPQALGNVCIVNNPKVTVGDFVEVVRDGFDRHGISTSVVATQSAEGCGTTLTYTALRSWDMTTYLSHAELRLWQAGRQIGFAEYHLRGKGGFALTKWQGTKAKMDPVIDQLLEGAIAGEIPVIKQEVQVEEPSKAPMATKAADAEPYEMDPAKRCDACARIGKP